MVDMRSMVFRAIKPDVLTGHDVSEKHMTLPASAGFLHCLLFEHYGGGNMLSEMVCCL